MSPKVILICIFILGLLLRLYNLHLDRPALYADEVSQYYYWQWLSTDHPITLDNINKYFIGLTLSFTWILGLTPLSIRLPAAIYGSLIPIAVYFLAHSLTSKNNHRPAVALTAALLSALLPWSFMISRIGHSHIPITVIITCLITYVYLRVTGLKSYLLAILLLIAGALFYPSFIIIAPFLLCLILYQILNLLPSGQKLKVIYLMVITIFILGFILIIRYQGFSGSGRGLDLALWKNVNVIADMNLYRGITNESLPSLISLQLPPATLSKYFYNYPLAIISEFSKRYLSFFSPDWLFFKGDPVLRHSTGQMGTFWPILLPFMVYGAFTFFNKSDKKSRLWAGAWIIASPVPAAITHDGAGYLLRAVTLLPFLTYFCALGIWEIYQFLKPKFFKWSYVLFLVFLALYSAGYFFFGYFHVYPVLAAPSYEFGFKELALYQQQQNQHMLVIWPGFYPRFHFHFWQHTSPHDYNNFTLQTVQIGNSQLTQTSPELYFSWPAGAGDLRQMISTYHPQLIVFPTNYLENNPEYRTLIGNQLTAITYPDHRVAFTVYTVGILP